MGEYFSSVRNVENRLQLSKQWSNVPKPKPEMKEPQNTGLVSDLPVIYDLIALALQTDSTRIRAGSCRRLRFPGARRAQGLAYDLPPRPGAGKHRWPAENREVSDGAVARFVAKMKSIKDGDGTLLDHSMVLFGSGMGNANAHTNNNLPIVLAGGGFRHGQHKLFSKTGSGPRRSSAISTSACCIALASKPIASV